MPQYQGIWTLAQAAQLQSTQRWATDPLFENTTLLLQADNAANGAQNNTFLDSSSNNFTITRNGNTTQGTFTPYSLQPGAWGNYLNGSTDYFRVSDNAVFDFGTGAFCIEMWFMLTADAAQNGETNREATLLAAFPDSGTLATTYAIGIGGNSTTTGTAIAFSIRQSDTIAYNQIYTATITKNVWHHIAVCRSGNDFAMFYDGLRVSSNSSYTYTVNTNHSVKIGALIYPTYNHYFPGYISNLRIVKGSSVYAPTSLSIAVPTEPLGTTSGGQTPPTGTQTSLLTCQSNRFVDNSSNAFAITVNGTPSVQAFSPFAPQYQYTPSVTGGSGYFDGTGDFLATPSGQQVSFGTGDFTIEAWMYFNSVVYPDQSGIMFGEGVGWTLYIFPTARLQWGNISPQTPANLLTGSTTLVPRQWYHVAITRQSGTVRMWLNGALDGSVTNAVDFSASGVFKVGVDHSTNYFSGYISSLRILKGTALYTTAFTPPTAPPTAITNTSLLLNFTNAGIYDGTLKNNLETVGNAQISTSVVKYGTGSMAFDGTNDALALPNSPVLQLGSADFTCEFWAYRLAATNMTWVFLNGNSSNFAALRIDTDTSGNVFLLMSTSGSAWAINTSGSAVLPLSTWTHIAAVRFGGAMRLYLNGVALISTTISGSLTAGTSQQVGANFGATQVVNGYIDDLRLTNGIARYTANFTPPTVALPRQ